MSKRLLLTLPLLSIQMAVLAPTQAQSATGPQPIADPSFRIGPEDLPPSALRDGPKGETSYRVDIDKDGKPTACTITGTSGNAELDAATCKIVVNKMRFIPATDDKGVPVAGTFSNSMKWSSGTTRVSMDFSPATPLGSPGDWVTSNDYPATSLRNDVEGTVGFIIATGANGVPTGCEISRSSGSAELDETTCNLVMTRARFSPAKNEKGKAVAGSYSNSVRWVIPNKGVPADFAPYASTFTFTIDANGHAVDCKWEYVGKPEDKAQTPVMPCDNKGQIFMPLFDTTGKPVARRVRLTNSAEFLDAQ